MTTIAIERELLVRIEKELFLAVNYGGTLRDEPLLKKVSAVLALASEFDSIIEAIGDDPAPSTAPDELERLKTESEERLQNCAALDRPDARPHRYRVQDNDAWNHYGTRGQAMTTREAFEDWYEVDCYPCEHSNWFRLDSDGDYALDEVQSAWRTWQAATAAALAAKPSMPAWHDADGSDLKEFVESLVALRERAATAAALERAAEVCVDISAHQLTFQQRKTAATCADAIRALKDET